jgi:hypothetical protein
MELRNGLPRFPPSPFQSSRTQDQARRRRIGRVQVSVARRKRQVEVVGHRAVGVLPHGVPCDRLGQDAFERLTDTFVGEGGQVWVRGFEA